MDNSNNTIPTNRYNDKFSSLIRPIKIFLPPRQNKENGCYGKDDDFVGRERLIERLFLWLSNRDNKMNSYLVTGFRGMGKTCLVDRTVERLTREIDLTVEFLAKISLILIVVAVGFIFVGVLSDDYKCLLWIGIICMVISIAVLVLSCLLNNPKNKINNL